MNHRDSSLNQGILRLNRLILSVKRDDLNLNRGNLLFNHRDSRLKRDDLNVNYLDSSVNRLDLSVICDDSSVKRGKRSVLHVARHHCKVIDAFEFHSVCFPPFYNGAMLPSIQQEILAIAI